MADERCRLNRMRRHRWSTSNIRQMNMAHRRTRLVQCAFSCSFHATQNVSGHDGNKTHEAHGIHIASLRWEVVKEELVLALFVFALVALIIGM